MPLGSRKGKRADRNISFGTRNPELEHYIIVTDTKETENNYFKGLKEQIPEKLRGRVVITTRKAETKNLIDAAVEERNKNPQYRKIWIVFDRDEVTNFDDIIFQAIKRDINVAWSNPCIEIWFFAYFRSMPAIALSNKCCEKFGELYYKKSGGEKYDKADPYIFKKLRKLGSLEEAIKRAENRDRQFRLNSCDNVKPSEYCPCTTMYVLVEEIWNRIKGNK